MKPLVAIGLGITLAGSAFILAKAWMSPGEPSAKITRPADSDSLRQVQLRLARLEHVVRSQRETKVEIAAAPERSPDDSDPAESHSLERVHASLEEDPALLLRREQEAAKKFYRELDAKFDAEPADNAWRVDMERVLLDVLRPGESTGIIVDSLDCRSRSCRTVLVHEAPRPSMLFIDAVLEATVKELDHSLAYEGGKTIIYSFRRD